MKDFEKFEDLTAEVFNILGNQGYKAQRDVKLQGPDGLRQIDILIEGKVGPISITTIIECKDYGKMVNVTKVDELHSKMQDVKAHVAILVSRKGFTKGAIQKAKRLGIKLQTVHKSHSEKWNFDIDVPVLITEATPILNFKMNLHLEEGNSIRTDKLVVNDIDVPEKFCEVWNKDAEVSFSSQELLELIGIKKPFFLRDPNTNEIYSMDDFVLELEVHKKFYFGNVRDLQNSYLLKEIIENKHTVLLDMSKLGEYKTIFAEYSEEAAVPNQLAINIRGFTKPRINGSLMNEQLQFKATLLRKSNGEKETIFIK